MTTMTVKPSKIGFSPPDKMTIKEMADELLCFKQPVLHDRRKLLLETFSSVPVSETNINNWLDAFILFYKAGFLPKEVIEKIEETIILIEDSSTLDPFLVQICEGKHFPSRLKKAACAKSKQNHG
jgi:hypothetical protein